jgi:hypothetical protein
LLERLTGADPPAGQTNPSRGGRGNRVVQPKHFEFTNCAWHKGTSPQKTAQLISSTIQGCELETRISLTYQAELKRELQQLYILRDERVMALRDVVSRYEILCRSLGDIYEVPKIDDQATDLSLTRIESFKKLIVQLEEEKVGPDIAPDTLGKQVFADKIPHQQDTRALQGVGTCRTTSKGLEYTSYF